MSEIQKANQKVLLYDPERCTGCGFCEVACAFYHFKQHNTKIRGMQNQGSVFAEMSSYLDPNKNRMFKKGRGAYQQQVMWFQAFMDPNHAWWIHSRLPLGEFVESL